MRLSAGTMASVAPVLPRAGSFGPRDGAGDWGQANLDDEGMSPTAGQPFSAVFAQKHVAGADAYVMSALGKSAANGENAGTPGQPRPSAEEGEPDALTVAMSALRELAADSDVNQVRPCSWPAGGAGTVESVVQCGAALVLDPVQHLVSVPAALRSVCRLAAVALTKHLTPPPPPPPPQAAIREAGGIPPLVFLLQTGNDDDVLEATGADAHCSRGLCICGRLGARAWSNDVLCRLCRVVTLWGAGSRGTPPVCTLTRWPRP